MSGGGNFPSQGLDPADQDNLGGAFRFIMRKALMNTDGMLPATVIAADDQRKFATVRPQVQVKGTDDKLTSRAQVAKVPIFHIGAGGFVMHFPVKPGDAGWIIASDRDISLYMQTDKEAGPNTNRIHSFEDGLFIPDQARKFVLSDDDADNAVWQALDGLSKITLGPAKIGLDHQTLVAITCPHVTVKDGDLKVTQGIGHFDHDPPASQPSITGALSAVSDSNAKAVLTSIVAALDGCGLAKDETT